MDNAEKVRTANMDAIMDNLVKIIRETRISIRQEKQE